jgi:hypothetical protein
MRGLFLKNATRAVMAGLILLVLFLTPQHAAARTPRVASSFQGKWEGGRYVRDKAHAPVGVNVNKQPCDMVDLDLTQEGDVLKGEYGAGIGWGARFESGEFSTKVKNNSATVQLESGWGGKVTVTISLRAGKLYWKVIKSEEENYFPREMILHRAK